MNHNGEVLEALEDCVELLEMIKGCCHNQDGMVDAQIRDAKAVIAKAIKIRNTTTAEGEWAVILRYLLQSNGKDETFERSEV